MKRLAILQSSVLAAAVGAWAANRAGLVGVAPAALAAVAAALVAASAVQLAWAAWRCVRRGAAATTLAWALLHGGLVLALGGGLVNWLFGVQGYLLLMEGDSAPVSLERLDGWAGGPLADPGRLALSVRLERVALSEAGRGYFRPKSQVAFLSAGSPPVVRDLEAATPVAHGSLRFLQGAFGFAPKIRIERARHGIVFDEWVPFRTARRGSAEVGFAGAAEVAGEALVVRGEIALDSLDEGMKGHPTMTVLVEKGGAAIGSAALTPGQFAEIGPEYRVGLVGLRKWSEVDLASRSLRAPVLAGFAAILLAGTLALGALWRRR